MNDYEGNIHRHIEEFGCSVTSVFDPDAKTPPFSYSIGVAKTTSQPELIVIGLRSELSHWIVNEYNRRAQTGEEFVPGKRYEGFLEGFDVQFGPVSREHRDEYMRSATWLHGSPDFSALQLIYPNTSGVWPWDDDADEWFRANQPILAGDQT
jgi:hypothetical protein